MKTQWMKGLIVLSMLSSICFAAQTQTATGRIDPFAQIINEYYAAWNSGDLDKAAVYYAKAPEFVFYDVAPMKYQGWSEYRAGVEKIFFANYTSVKLEPYDDLKITRRGTVVWTTLTFKLSGTAKDGKMLNLDCRHTAIWEKQNGKWLIVHEHVSTPLPD
jgi:ketosteroid isomerase-like protein